MNHSARRINHLIKILNARSYLEIGVDKGETLFSVKAPRRVGVDPKFSFDVSKVQTDVQLYETTSDEFFFRVNLNEKFDILFIDGLHTFEQTYRDFCNSLSLLNSQSIVIIDDTFPCDIFSSIKDQSVALSVRKAHNPSAHPSWHGDVFKIVFAIHDFHQTWDYVTFGSNGNPQTVLWRGKLEKRRTPVFDDLERISRLTYIDLLKNIEILKILPEEQAIELLSEQFG